MWSADGSSAGPHFKLLFKRFAPVPFRKDHSITQLGALPDIRRKTYSLSLWLLVIIDSKIIFVSGRNLRNLR